MGGDIRVPKGFLKAIRVPYGAREGELAEPCLCGYPTDIEGEDVIYLIQWHDGPLMFCHAGCVRDQEDA